MREVPVRSKGAYLRFRSETPFQGDGLRFLAELAVASELPGNRASWRRLRKENRRVQYAPHRR